MSKNNDEKPSCSVSGCGCITVILALGVALNIPAILNFIARMAGK